MNIDNHIIEENRALYDGIGNLYPAEPSVTIAAETIDRIGCYWFRPKNHRPNELVIYVHGGGYAIGSFQSHKAMVSHFAHRLERTVLFVEYALAPENPYPNGLNDVVHMYEWAAKNLPDHQIYLMGDSAGGGMVIATVHALMQKKLPAPKAVGLLSPWYNLETNNPSANDRQHLDQILNKEMVLNFAAAYAGKHQPEADPSKLAFEAFPPVFVAVGTHEILFDDALNFFDRVYKIQPKAQLKIYGGQGHVLTQLNISSPAARDFMSNLQFFFDTVDEA